MFNLIRQSKRALRAARGARRRQAQPPRAGQARADRRRRGLRQGRLAAPALAADRAARPLTPWKDPLPIPPKTKVQAATATATTTINGRDQYDAAASAATSSSSGSTTTGSTASCSRARSGASTAPSAARSTTPATASRSAFGSTTSCRPITRLRLARDHLASAQLPHRHRERRRAMELAQPGTSRIQHYCMARAGFADPLGAGNPTTPTPPAGAGRQLVGDDGGDGDLRETLTTLFIHDHRPEFTAPNLYKGLFMMVRAFDERTRATRPRAGGCPAASTTCRCCSRTSRSSPTPAR